MVFVADNTGTQATANRLTAHLIHCVNTHDMFLYIIVGHLLHKLQFTHTQQHIRWQFLTSTVHAQHLIKKMINRYIFALVSLSVGFAISKKKRKLFCQLNKLRDIFNSDEPA